MRYRAKVLFESEVDRDNAKKLLEEILINEKKRLGDATVKYVFSCTPNF